MSRRPIQLGVEVDKASMRRADRLLSHIRGGGRRALTTAINETLSTGRTRISKYVRDEVTLKKKDVDQKITIKRASRGQIVVSGTIRINETKFDLAKFDILPKNPVSQRGIKVKDRRPKIGVGVKVFKAGPREPMPRSWVFRGKRGLHVLHRPTRDARAEPRMTFGPSIPDALGQDKDYTPLRRELSGVLTKRLNSQVQRLLAGR